MLAPPPKTAPSARWSVQPESWAGLGKQKAKRKVGGHTARVSRAGALGRAEVPSALPPCIKYGHTSWGMFSRGPGVSYMGSHTGALLALLHDTTYTLWADCE